LIIARKPGSIGMALITLLVEIGPLLDGLGTSSPPFSFLHTRVAS